MWPEYVSGLCLILCNSSGGMGTLGNPRELKRTRSLSTTGSWVMPIPWSLPMTYPSHTHAWHGMAWRGVSKEHNSPLGVVECLWHRTPFATPEYVLCAADRFPRILYVSTHRLHPRRNLNRSIWCRIELSVASFGAQLFGVKDRVGADFLSWNLGDVAG